MCADDVLAQIHFEMKYFFANVRRRKLNSVFFCAHTNWICACTDLSDGGLTMAVFRMVQSTSIRIEFDCKETSYLFGEDQARYLNFCNMYKAEALMLEAAQVNIPVERVGNFLVLMYVLTVKRHLWQHFQVITNCPLKTSFAEQDKVF